MLNHAASSTCRRRSAPGSEGTGEATERRSAQGLGGLPAQSAHSIRQSLDRTRVGDGAFRCGEPSGDGRRQISSNPVVIRKAVQIVEMRHLTPFNDPRDASSTVPRICSTSQPPTSFALNNASAPSPKMYTPSTKSATKVNSPSPDCDESKPESGKLIKSKERRIPSRLSR
jgi:hypothetical protein